MNRMNKLAVLAVLADVGIFVSRTTAADPISPDRKPRLVAPIGHSQPIYSAAFSPDGKYLVTVNRDTAAILWEIKTGWEVRKFIGPAIGVLYCVTFSPDCNFIAIG